MVKSEFNSILLIGYKLNIFVEKRIGLILINLFNMVFENKSSIE